MKRLLILLTTLVVTPAAAQDCQGAAGICASSRPGALALIDGGPLRVERSAGDDAGVIDAVLDLERDLAAVSGSTTPRAGRTKVIVGTLGRNPVIDALVAARRIDVSAIRGKWEAFVQVVVDKPDAQTDRALVIVGSDRRGTIFGIYDLSRRIGVSPWNWWADVPVRVQKSLYVLPGARIESPKVKYRGIFLNDEEPALGNWARHTFGGINAQFYERVFELILRLKGNYLWPAMWGKSLWDDDPRSAELASRMGIVLGTSHHEPMVRAHIEWERYGNKTPWDYNRNPERLREFWRQGLVRNAGRETLVTVGMRGDGDEPMTEGTATELLERIVADQRKIIAEVTGRPASETPQVWALYKEVQDYYDKGMQVPDDVTLLFADDNWGNIRRLPKPGSQRPGGYGVYYHFDYVGGPRNYKWLNTNQVSRTWEQMHLAWVHGATRLWIVNVGDLKPMELPTSFFLDMAWDPGAMPLEKMVTYHRDWAAEQFGPEHAPAIGEVMDRTTRLLARRKPELVDAGTYTLWEWPRLLEEWETLEADAARLAPLVPAPARDAFYQLVLHPAEAGANLHRLYHAVAMNRRAVEERSPEANGWADKAEAYFARDKEISRRYEATAGGKWRHMMSQTHIGYTSWQQPDTDVMPQVTRLPAGTTAAPSPVATTPAASPAPPPEARGAFLPVHDMIAIEAEHFSRAVAAGKTAWRVIPGLGRTLSAVTPWPQVAASAEPGRGARLEYDVWVDTGDGYDLAVVASPSLDVTGTRGLRYGISIDDGPVRVVDLWAGTGEREWNEAVANAARVTTTHHSLKRGRHVVKLWMIDPGVVIQRIELSRKPQYRYRHLGPPESPRAK